MKHTLLFVTSFLDVSISDFDLYILKKYLVIPLLVLCIPILWGPALQCGLFPHVPVNLVLRKLGVSNGIFPN
jgi:hypothetical protein